MLDDKLLTEFMLRFYGYGTFSARIWFVGMEEAGGDNIEDVNRRFSAWHQRGRHELEDVYEYHDAIGKTSRWDEPVKLQKTWAGLIRILLCAQGRPPTTVEVKAMQRDTLGRWNTQSATCLIDLLPLPSPNTSRWLYSSISKLPFLVNRQAYREHMSGERSRHIQARIAQYRPAAVVFYGLAYLDYWQEISSNVMLLDKANGYYIGRQGETTYVATKHPAARGVTKAYFQAIGERLRTSPVPPPPPQPH